jgi:membrane-associated protein
MIHAAAVPMLGPDWLDPENLINGFIERFGSWALLGIVAIVIIETGLLFPFLPGDSLLFTAGLFTGTGQIGLPIYVVAGMLGVAAFIGPQIGYWIGRLTGPRIFSRPDSRIFKQAHVDRTHAFFERYGGRAIVLAQFVPFVRTYIPVAAGVGRMPYGHFIKFNVIGALVWGVGVTLLGYWLGGFPLVKENIEVALILIVAVSLLPMIFEAVKHQIDKRRLAARKTTIEADSSSNDQV